MPLLFFLLSCYRLYPPISAHCTTSINHKTFSKCIALPTQRASMAWTFHQHNGTLDLVFFGTFLSSSGWVGWGINPSSPEMTGTRALIAFPDPNSGRLIVLPYILDPGVKLHNAPLHSRHLDIRLLSSSAILHGTDVQIHAVMKLSRNKSKIHVVWNRGLHVHVYSPTTHPTSFADLSSLATIDVISGHIEPYKFDRKTFRKLHGIINAVSWGLLLPTGAVAARYLREVDSICPTWFYLHAGIQISAIVGGTIGFGMGIRLGELSSGVEYGPHKKLGFATICLGSLQTLALLFKPKTTNKFRKYWKSYHHLVGYACVVIGVVNVFQGFEVMGESRSSAMLGYCLCLSTLVAVSIALEVNSWVIFRAKSKEDKFKGEAHSHGPLQEVGVIYNNL